MCRRFSGCDASSARLHNDCRVGYGSRHIPHVDSRRTNRLAPPAKRPRLLRRDVASPSPQGRKRGAIRVRQTPSRHRDRFRDSATAHRAARDCRAERAGRQKGLPPLLKDSQMVARGKQQRVLRIRAERNRRQRGQGVERRVEPSFSRRSLLEVAGISPPVHARSVRRISGALAPSEPAVAFGHLAAMSTPRTEGPPEAGLRVTQLAITCPAGIVAVSERVCEL